MREVGARFLQGVGTRSPEARSEISAQAHKQVLGLLHGQPRVLRLEGSHTLRLAKRLFGSLGGLPSGAYRLLLNVDGVEVCPQLVLEQGRSLQQQLLVAWKALDSCPLLDAHRERQTRLSSHDSEIYGVGSSQLAHALLHDEAAACSPPSDVFLYCCRCFPFRSCKRMCLFLRGHELMRFPWHTKRLSLNHVVGAFDGSEGSFFSALWFGRDWRELQAT